MRRATHRISTVNQDNQQGDEARCLPPMERLYRRHAAGLSLACVSISAQGVEITGLLGTDGTARRISLLFSSSCSGPTSAVLPAANGAVARQPTPLVGFFPAELDEKAWTLRRCPDHPT